MTSKISQIIFELRQSVFDSNKKSFYYNVYGPPIYYHESNNENYKTVQASWGSVWYYYTIPSAESGYFNTIDRELQVGLEMIAQRIPVFDTLKSAQNCWQDFYDGEMKNL